jgi:hypothetical protein
MGQLLSETVRRMPPGAAREGLTRMRLKAQDLAEAGGDGGVPGAGGVMRHRAVRRLLPLATALPLRTSCAGYVKATNTDAMLPLLAPPLHSCEGS